MYIFLRVLITFKHVSIHNEEESKLLYFRLHFVNKCYMVLTLEISVITIMSIQKAYERKSLFTLVVYIHIHKLDMSQLNRLISQ
jgi:hypothetical protein